MHESGSASYRRYLEQNLKISYANIASNFAHFLDGVSLDGKKILDIGAGAGLFVNFLASHKNVNKIVAVDEYEGHGSDVSAYRQMLDLSKAIKSDIIEIIREDFNKFEIDEKFDAIFAINVMHHIVNSDKNLLKNKEVFDFCVNLFFKIKDLLVPGGIFMMQDVCRRNFSFIPYYIKQNRIIDWKTKHEPKEWTECLKAAGFKNIKVRFHTLRPFRKLPFHNLFFNHYLISIFLNSIYTISATV